MLGVVTAATTRRAQEGHMRLSSIVLLLAGLSVPICVPVFAQQQTPPVINFDSVPDPLKLPDNTYFGEVSGIAVNSKGHIFVLTRGNTTGPAYAAAAAQLL